MEQAHAAAHAFLGLPVELWGTWLAGLLTLAVYSFLYADNPVYKAAEHLFVGVSAAYGVVILFYESVKPDIIQPLFQPDLVDLASPKYILLVPIALGLLLLTRYIPRISYLARWPIAFTMGAYSGMGIPLAVQGNILVQMHGTMKPLWPGGEVTPLAAFNSALILIGVVCTLGYFYFSLEHKGLLGGMSRVGIWFLMVAFGAGFGNTVMARISLLIGRIQFLLYDLLPSLKPPFGLPHG